MDKSAMDAQENLEPNLDRQPEDENLIQLDLDEDVAQGVYANLVVSNYSQEEFVLDFVFLQPQMPKGKIRSRVIMSPDNAKRLRTLLENHVMEYEKKFGRIKGDKGPDGIRFSFN